MKYIVYCTTNIVNKKIYVGIHGTENPDVFDGYLGNGLNIKDQYLIRNPKEPFHFAVKKYGIKNFIRKTLKVFDTLDEALKLEAEIVNKDFIQRKDTYNAALGGGMPPIKTKTIYQYSLEGEFIKEWSSIVEASLFLGCGQASIGRAVFDRTPSMKFLWTDYKYDKLDLNNFKIDANKTYTYLYDNKGNLVNEFISITKCAEFINNTPAKVQKAISGKFCIAKTWYCSDIKYEIFPIPEKTNHKNDKLYQYDLEGNFIREWENFGEVKKYFNNKNIGIHAAIRLGHSCQGYQWSWKKVPFMKKLANKSGRVRKVGKYTKEGELVCVFNSVNEARRDIPSSLNVLRGKQKTAKGYIFKYIDE